jgi:hypothetical protein
MQSVTTLTVCDAGENHAGNQILGKKLEKGVPLATLETARRNLNTQAAAKGETEAAKIHSLKETSGLAAHAAVPDAYVLVIKDGVNKLTSGKLEDFKRELLQKEVDKRYFAYGQVRDKHARHNFLFGEEAQSPCYEEKKGTVYAWGANPSVDAFRRSASLWLDLEPEKTLSVGEVNHYYDVSKCYIGWHGDAERRVVVGARIGRSEAMPLLFHCHEDGKPIGTTVKIELNEGDVYVMSEHAVGEKWKHKGAHWRHATGCEKGVGDPMARWEEKQAAKARKAVKRAREGGETA